jgi:hypothetical protein
MRAIWFVVLAGCASAKSGDTLADSVRVYNDGVRWERFSVAAKHVPPKERSVFVEHADERAEDLKITDYEVIKVENKGDREATVQVKLSWYRESEGTLRETQSLQTWERHGKTWWMVDEARVKGFEMPGLQEPVGKELTEEAAATPTSAGTEE